MNPLYIGIGNRYRRDDGVGVYIAERLRDCGDVLVLPGEGTELMEAWRGREWVRIFDAVRAGGEPGSRVTLDAARETIPSDFFRYSTHAFGLAEAVEMSRVLGELPPDFVIHGIVGADFGGGEGLTPAVQASADEVAAGILSTLQDTKGTKDSRSSRRE